MSEVVTNTRPATYTSTSEPRIGTSKSSHPTSRISVTWTMPITMYGRILPTISSGVRTGVLISSSRLPRSRSRTIATAVNSTIVMVRITPIRPGTICTCERRSGL